MTIDEQHEALIDAANSATGTERRVAESRLDGFRCGVALARGRHVGSLIMDGDWYAIEKYGDDVECCGGVLNEGDPKLVGG